MTLTHRTQHDHYQQQDHRPAVITESASLYEAKLPSQRLELQDLSIRHPYTHLRRKRRISLFRFCQDWDEKAGSPCGDSVNLCHVTIVGIMFFVTSSLAVISLQYQLLSRVEESLSHQGTRRMLSFPLVDDPRDKLVATSPQASTARVPPWTIFYNIYLSNATEDAYETAIEIVREQMILIRSSPIVTALRDAENDKPQRRQPAHATSREPFVLYFNTIGKDGILVNAKEASSASEISDLMRELCEGEVFMDGVLTRLAPLKCVHMKHYDAGFEEVTLQDVHDYCSYQDPYETGAAIGYPNDRHTVIYIHSKGSFNAHGNLNSMWRPHLTNAVVQPECISMTAPGLDRTTANSSRLTSLPGKDTNPSCNVCGLQFYPLWSPVRKHWHNKSREQEFGSRLVFFLSPIG
jgi:hypothetical protein